MMFYTWFIEIKLVMYTKINYKKLTHEYLKNNSRKAAEEIQNLQNFTHWPIAKAKKAPNLNTQKHNIERNKRDAQLHYLPFYSYQKKAYIQSKAIQKRMLN